jgi:phosphoribosylanthranilate isomerase
VKICGVVDAEGALAAIRSGADAIGLNVVPGTPRALEVAEAAGLARLIRATAPPGARPRVVLVTADTPPARLAELVDAVDPDAIQFNGNEAIAALEGAARPAWKAIHVAASAAVAGAADRPPDQLASARGLLAGGIERVLLDTAGGPHPGGTGVRADSAVAASIARDVPITLAGGLTPANVAAALLAIPAVGVDVASGVEAPPVAGRRPTKDPFRVALFVKRAKAARDDRPNVAFGPAPVHPGLLDADAAGRWGMERDFGGRYVPETLMAALGQLESAYETVRHDPVFWADLRGLLEHFAGRPTALYRADRLAEAVA